MVSGLVFRRRSIWHRSASPLSEFVRFYRERQSPLFVNEQERKKNHVDGYRTPGNDN